MVGRRHLHTRKVHFDGYLRDDGLYEVEAWMQDISVEPTQMPFGALKAGGAIHDMGVVVTLDAQLAIRGVVARTVSGATPYCAEINPAYAALVGLRIGPGFKQAMRARVGGTGGCTHLTELLDGLATAAMQTIFAIRREERARMSPEQANAPIPRPVIVGTCHAYREDGEALQILWPPHRRAV